MCDVHIYTDGEIQDDAARIGSQLRQLFVTPGIKVNIYITTVEANSYNYADVDCQAGNTLYEILRDNSLTRFVKRFQSYNQRHCDTPFVAFSNPTVPAGYAPWSYDGSAAASGAASQGTRFFKLSNLSAFLQFLEEYIKGNFQTKDVAQADASGSSSGSSAGQKGAQGENQLMKFVHALSLTVSYLVKDKSVSVQTQLINLFCALFVHTSVYAHVRQLLLAEVENHLQGKATTFQAYKRNRTKVFQQAQHELFNNVKDAITFQDTQTYVSLPASIRSGADAASATAAACASFAAEFSTCATPAAADSIRRRTSATARKRSTDNTLSWGGVAAGVSVGAVVPCVLCCVSALN